MQTPDNKRNAQHPRGIQHLLSMEQRCYLYELICSGEAAFNFVRFSELDSKFKDAFYQLEKQHDYYKSMLTSDEQ